MQIEHNDHVAIRSDWDKLDKTAFDLRYPDYITPCWEWLLRNRKTNGMIESGALIETQFGKARRRCLIVPALLNWHLYGEEPVAKRTDVTLEMLASTNERLATIEAQLQSLVTRLTPRG